MDNLSKFYLNQTVNESRNTVLRKLRKSEKNDGAYRPEITKVVPGGAKQAPDGSCTVKSTKNNIFREQNTMHVSSMAPGGQLGAARLFLQFQESSNPSLAPTNLN